MGVWVSPYNDYKFDYVALNVDAALNFSILFAGWNPFRVVNVSALLGVAANLAFNNGEANDLGAMNFSREKDNFKHLWSGSLLSPVARGGVIIDFRCGDHWNINIDGNANMTTDHFNSKHADNADWCLNGL